LNYKFYLSKNVIVAFDKLILSHKKTYSIFMLKFETTF